MTTLPMWLKHALTVLLMMAAITLAGLARGASHGADHPSAGSGSTRRPG